MSFNRPGVTNKNIYIITFSYYDDNELSIFSSKNKFRLHQKPNHDSEIDVCQLIDLALLYSIQIVSVCQNVGYYKY